MHELFSPFTTKKAFIFFFLIGFCVFFYSLFNGFVGDDNTQIVGNMAIHSLRNFFSFFFANRLFIGATELGGSYYKPLLDITYMILYTLFGSSPFFFHMFQVTLFILNACLVFLLFQKFFPKSFSFFLSLVFLLHPMNSEVALYIADIQDALFFFFGMLSLLLVIKSQKAVLLSGTFLLLSLLSKETGVLFGFVLLLYAYIFQRKYFLRVLCLVVFVFGMYAILRIHAMGIMPHALINAPIGRVDFFHRVLNIPTMILFYFTTFFFPLTLSGSYQWAYIRIGIPHFFIPLFIDIALLVLLTLPAIFWHTRNQKKYLSVYIFFGLWFMMGLVFHLQWYPLDQTVAERWFYFSSVGILGIIGVLFAPFSLSFTNRFLFPIVILILILFSIRTFVRSLDWRDDFTIASHDSAISDSYNAEYIISHTYYMNGNLQEAKVRAEKSIQLFPYITNYTNLGAIESTMGDYKAAREAYMKALTYGDDTLPYENLASLGLVYGNPTDTIAFIRHIVLQKYPTDTFLWLDLAILEYIHGEKVRARNDLKKVKTQTESPTLSLIQYIFSHNKPLFIQIKNGNAMFYTN